MNQSLATKLNKMARADQRMRRLAMQTKQWNPEIDRRNTAELKKIIARYGWPTISLVGKKASFNAWLLAQHADHDLAFQKRVLRMLRDIYRKDKNVDLTNIAYLTDRILVHSGKPQIFGTQFYKNKKGKMIPRPIKDLKQLDNLRKKHIMPPFEEYRKL